MLEALLHLQDGGPLVPLNQPRIWGVTGPRPQNFGFHNPDSLLEPLTKLLIRLFRAHTPELINSRLALGMDTAAVLAARELGIPYVTFDVGKDQHARWSKADQQRYIELWRGAVRHEPVVLPLDVSFNQRVDLCNRNLVLSSEVLLALDLGSSGTQRTMRYAKHLPVHVFDLQPSWEVHVAPLGIPKSSTPLQRAHNAEAHTKRRHP